MTAGAADALLAESVPPEPMVTRPVINPCPAAVEPASVPPLVTLTAPVPVADPLVLATRSVPSEIVVPPV